MGLEDTGAARRANVKPIIFSAEMTKAILEGRKTQTRRVVKPKLKDSDFDYYRRENRIKEKVMIGNGFNSYCKEYVWHELPYKPGDVLWVREAWCEVPYETECIKSGDGFLCVPKKAYKADSKIDFTGIWKSPIHMPKEAARIFLRVVDVRVERLQNITPEDCRAEGLTATAYANFEIPKEMHELKKPPHFPMHRHVGNESGIISDDSPWWRLWFRHLWDSINSKRGFAWESNPWVWVCTFEKTEILCQFEEGET